MDAFRVVRDFERAVAEYTGAPYCVAVNSCTNALFLSLMWMNVSGVAFSKEVSIPKRTYVSVPMQIMHAGFGVVFDDRQWHGSYALNPYPIRDSARRFTSDMYCRGYECVSFHWSKILGVQQGGAILHDDPDADRWFRKARFDGRTEGVPPKHDDFVLGWHMYMSPEIAAEGLVRLCHLPKHNDDLPNSDYPDLSQSPLFQSPGARSGGTCRPTSSLNSPAIIAGIMERPFS